MKINMKISGFEKKIFFPVYENWEGFTLGVVLMPLRKS